MLKHARPSPSLDIVYLVTDPVSIRALLLTLFSTLATASRARSQHSQSVYTPLNHFSPYNLCLGGGNLLVPLPSKVARTIRSFGCFDLLSYLPLCYFGVSSGRLFMSSPSTGLFQCYFILAILPISRFEWVPLVLPLEALTIFVDAVVG